jgi:hypothetical protein
MELFGLKNTLYIYVVDSHETWKCVEAELQRQIRCFPYVEFSDAHRLQQVKKKSSDGRGISDYGATKPGK